MPSSVRPILIVLAGATLLGSMGAWGRAVYRFEGDPMVVVTWRAIIGVAALAGILAAWRPALLRIPWTVVLYAFAGLFLALGSGPGLWAARDYPPAAWGWIVGLALIPSLGGYALFTLGLRDLPASHVSVIATWEVVTAALLGWLLFGEHLTLVQIMGAALVCIGIVWIQRAEG